MVSFQCECCGDVLTKKKLDAHRGQCRSASYTCLDCMTNFHGTDYRIHTSCISEDQKYQGHLYKEKTVKTKKTVKISEPTESNSSKSRKAYVEDAPDADTGNALTIVEPPPEAPPPPPAAPSQTPSEAQLSVNVFDFLVPSDSPNASKVSLVPENTKPKKEVKMDYTPSVVGSEISSKNDRHVASKHDPDYDTKGFSYGVDPIPMTQRRERPKVEYFTPAPKDLARDLERHLIGNGNLDPHPSKSTDKKRKRHSHVEEFELARRPSREASEDAIMSDAPSAQAPNPVFHTGLTGGLTRLLSKDDYSEDEKDRYKETPAPSRSRPTQTYIVKESSRGRAEPRETSNALVKIKKRRSSDESRPRKHHRSQRSNSQYHNDDGTTTTTTVSTRRKHKHRSPSDKQRSSMRAIEYHKDGDEGDNEQQMVVYKARAEFFMSFVTKGPESEQGCSMNKALKRYHRERGERGREKEEEEKELWKGLRLKRNERGEVVVFF